MTSTGDEDRSTRPSQDAHVDFPDSHSADDHPNERNRILAYPEHRRGNDDSDRAVGPADGRAVEPRRGGIPRGN